MATFHGNSGVVKIGANTVAEVRSFGVTETMDTVDDTGMGDSYRSFKTGHGSWTATVECMWDDTDTNGQEGGWWGDDVAGVCCKPKQFSCWNDGDLNRAKMDGLELQDRAFARAVSVASGAWAGDMVDTTGGATHYHTAAIQPSWAAGHEPSARIGNHVFYNSVR